MQLSHTSQDPNTTRKAPPSVGLSICGENRDLLSGSFPVEQAELRRAGGHPPPSSSSSSSSRRRRRDCRRFLSLTVVRHLYLLAQEEDFGNVHSRWSDVGLLAHSHSSAVEIGCPSLPVHGSHGHRHRHTRTTHEAHVAPNFGPES